MRIHPQKAENTNASNVILLRNVTQLNELTKTGSAAERFCAKRPADAFCSGQIVCLLTILSTSKQNSYRTLLEFLMKLLCMSLFRFIHAVYIMPKIPTRIQPAKKLLSYQLIYGVQVVFNWGWFFCS